MGLTYDQLFPGRFIKAGEMHGRPVTLTVKDVYLDQLEDESGREKPQAVIAFNETPREMALNKTNAQCIVSMFGQDSGDWIGKRITLCPERDASGLSDSGLCLRIQGSPDIKQPVTAEIKLPRRKPQKRKLVPTNADKGAAEQSDDGDELDEALAKDAPPPEEETYRPDFSFVNKDES